MPSGDDDPRPTRSRAGRAAPGAACSRSARTRLAKNGRTGASEPPDAPPLARPSPTSRRRSVFDFAHGTRLSPIGRCRRPSRPGCRSRAVSRRRTTSSRSAARSPVAADRSTSGGNRTPNRRFWRPVLYQLSYARNGSRPRPASDRPAARDADGSTRRIAGRAGDVTSSAIPCEACASARAAVLLQLQPLGTTGLLLDPVVPVAARRCIPARRIRASPQLLVADRRVPAEAATAASRGRRARRSGRVRSSTAADGRPSH